MRSSMTPMQKPARPIRVPVYARRLTSLTLRSSSRDTTRHQIQVVHYLRQVPHGRSTIYTTQPHDPRGMRCPQGVVLVEVGTSCTAMIERNCVRRLDPRSTPAPSTAELLIPPQQRTARRGLQGYSRFIGRVGALAVALGVGVGFTTSMPGVARADDTDSSSSAESSSSEPSDPTTATDTTTSTTTSATTSTDSASPSDSASAGDSPAEGPTGIVQSSGGAQTGSYGPNATAPSSEGETDTVPATSDASEGGEPTETAAAADATTEAAADATTEAVATPDTVAPSVAPVPAQTPVLQIDSPTGENRSRHNRA